MFSQQNVYIYGTHSNSYSNALEYTWVNSRYNMACHPGGHYGDNCPDALSLNQVTATHLKTRASIQYKDVILPV